MAQLLALVRKSAFCSLLLAAHCVPCPGESLDDFLNDHKAVSESIRARLNELDTQLANENDWDCRIIEYSGNWVNVVAATTLRFKDGGLHYSRVRFLIESEDEKSGKKLRFLRSHRGVVPYNGKQPTWAELVALEGILGKEMLRLRFWHFFLIQQRAGKEIKSIVLPPGESANHKHSFLKSTWGGILIEALRDIDAGNAQVLKADSSS